MYEPLQLAVGEVATLVANYGFAVVMAILMWRYITNEAQKTEAAIRENTQAINRMNRTLDRLEERTVTAERARLNSRPQAARSPAPKETGD